MPRNSLKYFAASITRSTQIQTLHLKDVTSQTCLGHIGPCHPRNETFGSGSMESIKFLEVFGLFIVTAGAPTGLREEVLRKGGGGRREACRCMCSKDGNRSHRINTQDRNGRDIFETQLLGHVGPCHTRNGTFGSGSEKTVGVTVPGALWVV